MAAMAGARITVAGVGGAAIDLRWLADVTVPTGIRVDIADLGSRVDITVARGEAYASVVLDLKTAALLASQRQDADVEVRALIELLTRHCLRMRGGATQAGTNPTPPGAGQHPRVLFERVNWFRGSDEPGHSSGFPLDRPEGRTAEDE